MAGRPRSTEITNRVLAATRDLLSTGDYGNLTMDAVATRAGVNKPAVYRRYASKEELVVDAISSTMLMEIGDLGDSERELEALVFEAFPYELAGNVNIVLAVNGGLQTSPAIRAAVRDHIIRPFRTMAEELIGRAQARGAIRADVDPEMAFEMLNGQFYARAVAGRGLGHAWRRRAYETWRKVLAPPPSAGR